MLLTFKKFLTRLIGMNILIVFATYSGGTRIAAHDIESKLKAQHAVTVIELDGKNFPIDVNNYDVVVFGSPSWLDEEKQQGRPHFHLIELINNHKQNLHGKKCAVFALGDKYYAQFTKAADYLVEYVKEQGGELILEPLRINAMLFHEAENTKAIEDWTQELLSRLN